MYNYPNRQKGSGKQKGGTPLLSAIKNFLITLFIAAAIFGVIAYFATQFVTATVSDIMDEEESALDDLLHTETETESSADVSTETGETAEDPEQPEELGNSFSFVVVTSGYRPEVFGDYIPTVDELKTEIQHFKTASDSYGYLSREYRERKATAVVLVRVDKDAGEVTYTYITPETRVFTTTGYHTLGEIYTYYGYRRIGDYVTALTGIRVDYTILLDGYNFDEFLRLFGTVWLNNPKDIYAEGLYHTTRSSHTRERSDGNGGIITDQYANSHVLSAGGLEFNEYSSNILNTMKERSSPDIEAKGTYTIEILMAYLTRIAQLTEAEFLEKMEDALLLETDENGNVIEPEEGDPAADEPLTPILQSDLTPEEAANLYGLLAASLEFEPVTISYPGTYMPEDDQNDAYFDPDIKTAIKRFLPYRFAVQPETAAE